MQFRARNSEHVLCAHKYIHPPNAKEMHYATIVWKFARHISAGDRQTDTQTHTRTLQDTFQLVTLLVAVISSPVLIWHSVRLKKQCHKAKSVSNGAHRGNGE